MPVVPMMHIQNYGEEIDGLKSYTRGPSPQILMSRYMRDTFHYLRNKCRHEPVDQLLSQC